MSFDVVTDHVHWLHYSQHVCMLAIIVSAISLRRISLSCWLELRTVESNLMRRRKIALCKW